MALIDQEVVDLARACIETPISNELGLDDDPWWKLSELVHGEPIAALDVAVAMSSLTENMDVLCVLDAGTIEDLLAMHPATLKRILQEAQRGPGFRKAFRCVWTGRMEPSVKVEVDAALSAYGGNL